MKRELKEEGERKALPDLGLDLNLMKRELKARTRPASSPATSGKNLMKRELKGSRQVVLVLRLEVRESHEERIESLVQQHNTILLG